MENIQDTSSGKTSPAPSVQTKAKTSDASSKRSAGSKTMNFLSLDLRNGRIPDASWVTDSPLPGDSSMLNFGEFPKEENASTLSQILQAGVPEKYYGSTPKFVDR